MARIFLCHASEDKIQVRDVYQRLAVITGFEPWLDEEELLPGQLWEAEIPRALKASDFILIFFSSTSVAKRGYVQREMKLALDAWQEIPGTMIHTIPVRLDECEIPEPFRRYHYANLFDPHGFDRLVRALHRGLEQRSERIPESLETPPAQPEPTTIPLAIEDETLPTPPPSSYEAPASSSKPEPEPITPSNAPAQPAKKHPQSLWRNPIIIAALIAAMATIIAATIPDVRTFVAKKLAISRPTPAPPGTGSDPTSQTPLSTQESHKANLPKTITNSIGMEFVLIPAGTFTMGSPDSDTNAEDNEKPAHQVTISQPFYMGKYEVTQAQWKSIMGTNPSELKGDNHPVETVSWEDVQQFIRRLNKQEKQASGTLCRLPTEAEWEYVARAGTTTRYSFGDNAVHLEDYGWYSENSGNTIHPVGKKLRNPWGLYDMHGNVSEWVQDWYADDHYTHSPSRDPQGPATGAYRVIRGGGWDGPAQYVRAAGRFANDPGYRDLGIGFRCSSSSVSQ
jgi:formylglycine-generating enzyme required for sulfatase activity